MASVAVNNCRHEQIRRPAVVTADRVHPSAITSFLLVFLHSITSTGMPLIIAFSGFWHR